MKKKIFLGIGIAILILLGFLGYAVYKDLQQEDVLKHEVIRLDNMDLVNDNYSISIKTTGDYAYVENAIKKFYKELSDNIKELNFYLSDDDLMNILSADNFQKDGPKCVNSYQTVDTVKVKSTKALEKIASLCDEKYIEHLLDHDKVSNYYVDFYKKLMYTEQDIKDFAEIREEMQELSTNLNLFLDKVKELLNMLERNSNSWKIVDGRVYFDTSELVDEYNNLYNELKKIADEKLDASKYSVSDHSDKASL